MNIIVNTPTQENLNSVLQWAKKKGMMWKSGQSPTEYNPFNLRKEKTHVFIDGYVLTHGSNHNNLPKLTFDQFEDKYL